MTASWQPSRFAMSTADSEPGAMLTHLFSNAVPPFPGMHTTCETD